MLCAIIHHQLLPCRRIIPWIAALAVTSASAVTVTPNPGSLSQVYDGHAKVPAVTTVPSGLPVDFTYRNLAPSQAPVSSLAFNNSPDTLALHYKSVSFASNSMNAFGNYIRLGGSARKLESCDVTMDTWASAANYPGWAATNPAGYSHPVTLTFYRVTDTQQLVYLTEVTNSVFVPWKPATLPNGLPYTENGYSFRTTFAFPDGFTLPEKVVALVSYNTQNAGFQPLHVAGPYNELNVALTSQSVSTVGSDADFGATVRVGFNASVPAGDWLFPYTGLSVLVPMIRLHALSTQTNVAPVDAGSYEVTANISDSTYAGTILGTLQVAKAPASLTLGNLTAYYDGAPKPAALTTSPSGIAGVNLSYAGSASPPKDIGTYPVSATLSNPNYSGEASAQLVIRPSFHSWVEQKIASGKIPSNLAGDSDDPDHTGIPNLMTYALNLDSVAVGDRLPLLPKLQDKTGRWIFTYRRNLDAGDVSYVIEHSGDLSSPGSWQAVTGEETILSDDGHTRVSEVSLPTPSGAAGHFYRLRVSH